MNWLDDLEAADPYYGRHAAPPVGSAAREATASPYAGRHREHDTTTTHAKCEFCKRPIVRFTADVWYLVYVEYERTWLCDALDMEFGHKPVEQKDPLP